MSFKDGKENGAFENKNIKEDSEVGPFIKKENSNVSQREREKEDRRYKLGIGLFVVLNILLIGLIVITAYYVTNEKNVTIVRDSDICVPCEDLRLHPDDTIEGIDRRGENKDTCCVKDKDRSDVLIGYFIDHWLKWKLATEKREFTRYECQDNTKYATRKPIIKLVGRSSKQTGNGNVLWNGESDLSIYLNDDRIIYYENHGVIEIRKSGIYQVFSQIVLEHDMNDHEQQDSIYHHSVILTEAGAPEDNRQKFILKVSNTYCKSGSRMQTITSYIGGAFELKEGDRLAVNAHNISDIVPVPHMNFFGVYML